MFSDLKYKIFFEFYNIINIIFIKKNIIHFFVTNLNFLSKIEAVIFVHYRIILLFPLCYPFI